MTLYVVFLTSKDGMRFLSGVVDENLPEVLRRSKEQVAEGKYERAEVFSVTVADHPAYDTQVPEDACVAEGI